MNIDLEQIEKNIRRGIVPTRDEVEMLIALARQKIAPPVTDTKQLTQDDIERIDEATTVLREEYELASGQTLNWTVLNEALTAALARSGLARQESVASEDAVERLYEHVRTLGFHGPEAKPYGERSEEHKAKWRTALAAALTHPAPDARREALEEIAAERKRQVELEGWTAEHDDEHVTGQMASAAACYASPEDFGTKEIPRTWSDASRYMDAEAEPIGRVTVPSAWPWDGEWWKPGDTRRNLIKAGALIVAEIERLDRALTSEPAK